MLHSTITLIAVFTIGPIAAPAAGAAQTTSVQPEAPAFQILPRMQGCEESGGADEILVCGTRDQLRFRLPPSEGFDPYGQVESVSRERHRLMEGGESGIHSCGNVGMSSRSGCELRGMRRNEQQGRDISAFGDININGRRNSRQRPR
jgi:hypothetical protein